MAPKPWPKRPWPEAVPRYVTPRNPDRDTLGPQVVQVCRDLGYEPMPWQRDVWDTQYELDDRGRLWYREARITVPRQSAKTTSTLVRQVHRCRYSEELGWGERPVCAFTAQHASDARDKMVNEWMPTVARSPYVELLRGGSTEKGFLRSNGKESIKWENGGRMITFPPSATGAHGGVFDLVDIDEGFAFADNRAEQGARHAMITRKSPQIVIQSTAGTAESTYFREKVDDGRERVERQDPNERVYYVEYSVGPEDDIHNPEHWPRWMPALGYTIDIDHVQIEHDTLDPAEFYRAYGNGWTASSKQIIPADKWAHCYAPKSFREGKVWMSVDAAPGTGGVGRSASVAVASWREREIHVEVIAHGPGIAWVPGKIGALTRKHHVQSLWIDPTGPIRQVLPDIRDTSMAIIEVVDASTMAAACERFHQAVLDRTVRHRNQPMLEAAVQGAAKRVLDDSWAWKRRTSTSDISPLVACTLAHWAAAINGERGLIMMATGR
jgi:phage terminase large subunit-like protein